MFSTLGFCVIGMTFGFINIYRRRSWCWPAEQGKQHRGGRAAEQRRPDGDDNEVVVSQWCWVTGAFEACWIWTAFDPTFPSRKARCRQLETWRKSQNRHPTMSYRPIPSLFAVGVSRYTLDLIRKNCLKCWEKHWQKINLVRQKPYECFQGGKPWKLN